MSWARASAALLLGVLLGVSVACSGAAGAECQIRGVVVDVQDGEPLVGVHVEGPQGARAVTDPHGRFVLGGMQAGESGVVRAWRSDGWEVELNLRPLAADGVQIVLHLAPH